MLEAVGDRVKIDFDKPENVVLVQVDWNTGKPVKPDREPKWPVINEAFLSGREPKTTS